MKKIFSFLLLTTLLLIGGKAWGEGVTDVLNQSLTGVTGTSYTEWSGKTSNSDAVYAGQSAGGNSSIQLRSNNSNSGVVTTTSGGKAKKVVVVWQSSTSNGRTLNVYGKNSAYSAATDLYNTSNQGTLLGTIVCGTSTELTISDDYEYIGFRSASGAMYLTSVSITWETGGSGETAVSKPTFSVAAGTYTTTQSVELSCATEGATIYYTTDGVDPTTSSTIYSSAISVSTTTTIKAIGVKDGLDNSSVASATYTIIALEHAGTQADPYTVADARSAIDANTGITGVYATGVVSEIVTEYSTQYSNITFDIIDEGGSNTLRAFRCVGDDAANVQVGDIVVVSGDLTKYGSIYEFGQGCSIVSLVHPAATVCEVPTFSPVAGTYTSAQSVELACATEDATIYYTTDGTTPTTNSSVYSSAISVSESMTIKAIAVKDGLDDSDVATAAYVINIVPIINAESVDLEYDATSGEIAYTITNATEANLSAASTADWISNITVTADKVTFTTTANDGNTDREATITLSYTGADDKVITVAQAHFVVDYATLPFAFDGGKSTISETDGLTESGLGSDYGSSPYLKFDNTSDYVILKINEVPGTLTFDIKGNSFSGGTFKVQTSADGTNYTDLETYTELGNTQSEELDNLASTVRYIKWIYTEKSSGNVALGNIALAQYVAPSLDPSITVSENLVEATSAETEGTITVTYNNITDVAAEVYFCNAQGDAATYDWVDAEIDEDNNVYYTISANTGEARTAYLKVYALDDEAGDVYSELITISQEAYVAPSTDEWVLTSLASLNANDVFVIVGNNGSTYAMTNDNGASSAPATASVTITDGKLSGTIADNIKWNISGNATDGYVFYPNGSDETWLYCTNANNGVRVGTNDNKLFTVEDGYLKNSATSRYVGIYNSQDWRCYTGKDGNINGQSFSFYKKVSTEKGEVTVAAAAGYTTYYNSTKAYTMPTGLTGYVFNTTNGLEEEYVAGEVVPANTALVLGGAAGNYELEFTTGGTAPEHTNQLLGTDAAEMTTGGNVYYALSLDATGANVGFYWMNETGAAFLNGANKAYLALTSNSEAPRRFLFNSENNATDIQNVEANDDVVKFFENGQMFIRRNGVVYDVTGQVVR